MGKEYQFQTWKSELANFLIFPDFPMKNKDINA